MKKILLYTLAVFLIGVTTVQATPVSWDFTANVLTPIKNAWTGEVKVPYLTATSTATSTFAGPVTIGTPLGATSGGTGYNSYTVGDIFYANSATTLTKLGVGSSSTVLTMYNGVPSWQIVPSAGTRIYMFALTNSDIAGYESMPSLTAFTVGATTSVAQVISTTPTIIEEFVTAANNPNVTVIPAGTFEIDYQTEKAAGSINYYTYAEIYKRTTGGTETLLTTSEISTQTAVNTIVNVSVEAILTTNQTLNLTDRIVVKIYGVTLSSTANVSLYYDDNTNSRMEMPSALVDATNFVPYTGATANVDLGVYGLTTQYVTATSTTATSTFAGNINVSGNTILGTTTISKLNGVIIVDGINYAQTGAGIQSALNDCSSVSWCSRVHLPTATYAITSTLSIPSNITLSGNGDTSLLQLNNTINADVIKNTTQTGSGNVNIIVRDFKIDGNGDNNLTTGRGIYFKLVASSTIQNITIVNTRTNGISIEGTSETDKTAQANKIIGNKVSGVKSSTSDGFYIIYGKDNVISDNIFTGNGRYGAHINRSQNNAFQRNVANSNTSGGIELFNASTTLVIGNQASQNSGTGIKLESNANSKTNYNVISGNMVDSNGSYGLLGGTSGGTKNEYNNYTGNIVTNNGDDGLVVFHSPYAVVDGNTVRKNADQGIPVDNSKDAIISNNLVELNSSEGIEIKNSSHNVVVTGNIVKNNGQVGSGGQNHGIVLETGITGAIVSDNRVFDDQSSKTQTYGIRLNSGSLNNHISNNNLEGNLTGTIQDLSGGTNLVNLVSSTSTGLYSIFLNSIGIGTTTPTTTLHVVGTSTFAGPIFNTGAQTLTTGNAVCYLATGEYVFAGANTCVTSSERWKQDIENLDNEDWKELLKLDVKDFNYKPEYADNVRDAGGKRLGVIAEEVEKVDTRLVQYGADGKPLTVHFDGLIALLIQATQEQQKQLEGFTGAAKKSAQDNYQWIVIGLLALVIARQQWQINKLVR